MPLRKKSSRPVTGFSALITIAFYTFIAAIFWNVGGGEIIKEFVISAAAGKKPPPPPPPKRNPPKIALKQPPKIRPKFTVTQPVFLSASVRPDFGKAIIPVMDDEADMSQITRMAKMYDVSAVNQSLSQMKTATLDIGSKLGFGLGDIASGKKTLVVGTGKRIRARIILAQYGGQGYLNGSMPILIQFLNAQTNIQVSQAIKKIEAENSFENFYCWSSKKIKGASETELDLERKVIKRLSKEISFLSNDMLGNAYPFSMNLKSLWLDYLCERFPLSAEKAGATDLSDGQIVKEAIRQYKLPPFEKTELGPCTQIMADFPDKNLSHAIIKKRLQPVYEYLRKAEMLNYPFICGNYEPYRMVINHENYGYLKNYLLNGGFFYLDDSPISLPAHQKCRKMIATLMETPMDPAEESLIEKTYANLSRYDRKVAGYQLGINSPSPFHPDTYFPFSIPVLCNVTLKIYNRIGTLIRTILVEKAAPGLYSGAAGNRHAIKWDSCDDLGQPVESGTCFAQMTAGLFQQTHRIEMSDLRMLDTRTHPVFTSFYTFEGVPTCKTADIRRGDKERERPYGTTAFGWSIDERTVLLYTEWAGILSAPFYQENEVNKQRAIEFFANVLVFAITQPGSVAQKSGNR